METLYQVSTFKDFENRRYDGKIKVKTLLSYGNIGFGTYSALDGEMMILDGKIYKAKGNCRLEEAADSDRTPFATVAVFKPKMQFRVDFSNDYNTLCHQLDARLQNEDWKRCVVGRIDTVFQSIEIHSVWPVKMPYEALKTIVSYQKNVVLTNIKGTLIGIRCPKWAAEKNVVGWHFHFISEDLCWGGHVNNLKAKTIEAALCLKDRIQIID